MNWPTATPDIDTIMYAAKTVPLLALSTRFVQPALDDHVSANQRHAAQRTEEAPGDRMRYEREEQ